MGSTQIKKEIKEYIDQADDRILKAVYAMLKEYTENATDDYELSEEQIAILDERQRQHWAGQSKSYTVKEVRKMLLSKNTK